MIGGPSGAAVAGGPSAEDKPQGFQALVPDLQLTEPDWLPINSGYCGPCRPTAGCFCLVTITSQSIRTLLVQGGVPEWLKGTGCKPVGYAYVGSNPTPSTSRIRTDMRV